VAVSRVLFAFKRGCHLSRTIVADGFQRPTRNAAKRSASNASFLFGLASSGACIAASVARSAVSFYLAFSPLPVCFGKPAVCFLLRYPYRCRFRPLAGTLLCDARTFLCALSTAAARHPFIVKIVILCTVENLSPYIQPAFVLFLFRNGQILDFRCFAVKKLAKSNSNIRQFLCQRFPFLFNRFAGTAEFILQANI